MHESDYFPVVGAKSHTVNFEFLHPPKIIKFQFFRFLLVRLIILKNRMEVIALVGSEIGLRGNVNGFGTNARFGDPVSISFNFDDTKMYVTDGQ